MKRFFTLLLIGISILISGCGGQAETAHRQDSIKYDNSTLELTKKIKTLNISVDSGKLQIFCWDNPNISSEIKYTARAHKSQEQLQKLLGRFTLEAGIKDSTCNIYVKYNGKIKNSEDVYSDIKLTIPRWIKDIKLEQSRGSFILEDKYEGNIQARLDSVNTEIRALYGALSLECGKGNVRLDSGRLSDGSAVRLQSGNIYIKNECGSKAGYSFETGTGNINLNFPAAGSICLNAVGTIANNQFTGLEGDIMVNAEAKIGKISVNGY